jgi:hypothetical protein
LSHITGNDNYNSYWNGKSNLSAKDLDLTGKIRNIACSNSDAIGYVYRDGNKTMISFDSSEEITAGSRCEHLKGQVMELDWGKIYID